MVGAARDLTSLFLNELNITEVRRLVPPHPQGRDIEKIIVKHGLTVVIAKMRCGCGQDQSIAINGCDAVR
jgi:hypothetical protein